MERRTFLWTLGAAALGSRAGQAWGASPPVPDARLLVVFLRGGLDGASVMVPWASPAYFEARPNIAVSPPGGGGPASAMRLDADWALHPALAGPLGPLWDRRELALVPFFGTPDLSRSHFETQELIESGEAPDHGERGDGSGFLSRLAEAIGGSRPIAFTDRLPRALTGPLLIPNVSLKQVGKPGFDERQAAILTEMYRGSSMERSVAEGLELEREVQRELEPGEASRNAISAKGFELEALRMAVMMRDRFDLGFIDVGGWDTHVNQPGALGPGLDGLGKGLAAFAGSLGAAWSRTVVVVFSEFGRTFRENGGRGTDHGHGGVAMVMGGAVRGGLVAGRQVAVSRETLFQDRDLPMLNDVREVLGGLFRRLYGLGDGALARIFPEARPTDIGLL
jgi:uncharacterized protein (DUF1501 family)